jgi:adenylosuccinate lyase
MATEELILRAVHAGGDRQAAHEVIRRHSVASARAMKDAGGRNDMLERLAGDPDYGVAITDLREALDPHRFIGRSAAQVDEFLEDVVEPLLAGSAAVEVQDTVEVRV